MNTLKNLTPVQWIGIVLVMNGAIIGSTAQLTDLFGAHATHILISIASLGNSILGGFITFLTGQGAQIANVAAMGARIEAGKDASPALARAALDPGSPVLPADGARAAIIATAKGAA